MTSSKSVLSFNNSSLSGEVVKAASTYEIDQRKLLSEQFIPKIKPYSI